MLTAITMISLLGFDACASPEKRLFTARQELRRLEDALYVQYGGSGAVTQVYDATRPKASMESGKLDNLTGEIFLNAAKEMDRAQFFADCLRVGQGERVAFLTEQGRAFFSQDATVKACSQIAEKTSSVQRLEAEIEAARPSAGATP
jgi:hypothetical protein